MKLEVVVSNRKSGFRRHNPECTCRCRSGCRDSGTDLRCRRSYRAPREWQSSCPGSHSQLASWDRNSFADPAQGV